MSNLWIDLYSVGAYSNPQAKLTSDKELDIDDTLAFTSLNNFFIARVALAIITNVSAVQHGRTVPFGSGVNCF